MTSHNALAPPQTHEKRKVRVLFLNTRSALGADVAVHLTLIQNLDPDRVAVFVATNRNSVDLDKTLRMLEKLPKERVVVTDLGHEMAGGERGALGKVRSAARNLVSLGTLFSLAGYIRKNRIDLVHATDRPRDALFATVLTRLAGCRNLVHVHISWNEHFGRATRWALARCNAVLAISEFTRQSFERGGVPREKLYMAHNAVDVVRFDPDRAPRGAFRQRLGIAATTPLIGIVARIMVWKGHLELVEALARVRKAVPDVRLAIVGAEDLLAAQGHESFAAQVRTRIGELGLEQNVLWAGWYDDIPGVMQDIDVLAMPSWEEPFGLAVIEALAMRTPVVGFASGALPEIFTDGEEGRLVPAKDVAALADALVEILQDAGLRECMGEKGRERVLNAFTPRRQAQEVEAIYRAVVGRDPADTRAGDVSRVGSSG